MTLRSPPFEFLIAASAVPAGGSISYDFEGTDSEASYYAPFNTLTVSNFSGQRLKITYAGGHSKIMRPNSSMQIEQYGIRSIIITNMDAVNANDDIIELIVQKEVTEKHLDIAKISNIPLKDVINGVGW